MTAKGRIPGSPSCLQIEPEYFQACSSRGEYNDTTKQARAQTGTDEDAYTVRQGSPHEGNNSEHGKNETAQGHCGGQGVTTRKKFDRRDQLCVSIRSAQ